MTSADLARYKTVTINPQGRTAEKDHAVEARLRALERGAGSAGQTYYAEDLAEISTTTTSATHTPAIDLSVDTGQLITVYFQCEMKASVASCDGGAILRQSASFLPGPATNYLILKAPATTYSGNPWANAPGLQGVSLSGSNGMGCGWQCIAAATGDFTLDLTYGHISGAAGTNYWKNRMLWVEVR